jgi:hypothetical protein
MCRKRPHPFRTGCVINDERAMEIMENDADLTRRKSLVRQGVIVFQGFPFAMCKIGKLSFVAGAELPKRYLVT